MDNLLNKELKNKNLKGLTFGDIFFTTMKEQFGNFSESVEKSKDVLNIVGKVLPVTLDEMQICAELSDGTIIEKRDNQPLFLLIEQLEVKDENLYIDKDTDIERMELKKMLSEIQPYSRLLVRSIVDLADTFNTSILRTSPGMFDGLYYTIIIREI